MAKTRLLQAVCTIAMLAATPAFAQRPEAGMTGPNGQPNPAASQPAQTGSMMAADNTGATGGAGSSEAATPHVTHHSAMGHSAGAMHGRTDTSQDATVDRLNEQSYQAAQQGQTFSATGSGSAPAMPMPATGSTMTKGMSGGDSGGSAGGAAAGAGAGSTGTGGMK